MNLQDKVKLVNDLIRENRDVTIKVYVELLKELERIERTMAPKPAEGKKLNRKHQPSI